MRSCEDWVSLQGNDYRFLAPKFAYVYPEQGGSDVALDSRQVQLSWEQLRDFYTDTNRDIFVVDNANKRISIACKPYAEYKAGGWCMQYIEKESGGLVVIGLSDTHF
ncbi:MAG: hypothetical protein FWD76_02400 [Firmicutes bacterium]|nr:hypothetical protein [Bacillota bacterium]